MRNSILLTIILSFFIGATNAQERSNHAKKFEQLDNMLRSRQMSIVVLTVLPVPATGSRKQIIKSNVPWIPKPKE
jgi:hypothetical protein